MAKTFAVTTILFTAIQEALSTGQPLDEYAACAVKYDRSLPEGTTIQSYMAAVETYKATNAVAMSVATLVSQAAKLPVSKAKSLAKLDAAVQAHNEANTDGTVRILFSGGRFSVESVKATRKGKGTGEKESRRAARDIGEKGSKQDNYSFVSTEVPSTGKNKAYECSLNGEVVSNVAQALADLVNSGTVPLDGYTGKAMQKYYSKLIS